MKTLTDHLILFDAECPMCRTYTKAFVGAGLLEKNGRAAYQEYPSTACPNVNWQRAVNEIALVNQKTGEVTYGIKSLLKIAGTAMPFFRPLLQFPPFIWLMTKAYAFISYNRRVIIPPSASSTSFAFQPSFKMRYRIAYLIFTWFLTSYILSVYANHLAEFLPAGPEYREYLICGGQIIFQALVVQFHAKEQKWAYLGNMMTISFAGALLLMILSLIGNLLTLSPIFYLTWFGVVVSLMFLEHIRRTRLLELGNLPTVSWVIYRLVVLFLIFFPLDR